MKGTGHASTLVVGRQQEASPMRKLTALTALVTATAFLQHVIPQNICYLPASGSIWRPSANKVNGAAHTVLMYIDRSHSLQVSTSVPTMESKSNLFPVSSTKILINDNTFANLFFVSEYFKISQTKINTDKTKL